MNRVELEEMLEEVLGEIAPGFQVHTTRKGEIIIQTGLVEDEDGEIFSNNDSEELDEDEFEGDEELLLLEEDDDD